MYILKNALISITRNKGRNLLIGIIIVVIALASAVTLAIRNSASSLINSYENKYDVKATIGVNRENMRGGIRTEEGMSDEDRDEKREEMQEVFAKASNITEDEINKYGDSKYVKEYYYQVSVGVNADDLEKASMENSENNDKVGGPENGGREKFNGMNDSDFTLTGYSTLSAMEDFINGRYKITEGKISTDMKDNSCVISEELATLNDIKLNDEISFTDPNNEDNKITLKVAGIYDEESDTEGMMGMFAESANNIITNANVVNNFTQNDEDIHKTITPTFILTSKKDAQKFEKELTSKGLSEYLTVQTNLDEVENSTKTISNVKTFATTFLIITLIIGGAILFVISMINIRERKYEIGVLRTIGMKKSHLTMQFVCELLIVSFVSLLIGTGLGAMCSVPVSNHLLESEISNSEAQKQNVENNFGGHGDKPMFDKINGTVEVEAFDSIDAAVDLKVLLELLGIGVALTLVSALASMISIQKFSPLTILKERS